MNMGVMLEFLIPRVEDGEEADLGAEMLRVCGDLDECLGATAEQQAIDHLFVL